MNFTRSCDALQFDALIGYQEGLELQRQAFEKVKKNELDGILLLLQHKPVFTIGRAGGRDHLLVPEESLKDLGIDLYPTSRGGNITYHGPGQLVVYPIFNLSKWRQDVHWYVNRLEEVIIRTLSTYGLVAGRKPKFTGVWIGDGKIAAIGVAVKQWVTMHGLALNLQVNKEHFHLIHPCGITGFDVVSLADFIETINSDKLIDTVKKCFSQVFETMIVDNLEARLLGTTAGG